MSPGFLAGGRPERRGLHRLNSQRNGTGKLDNLMEQLRVAIVTVNSTRVDASFAEGLSSWITSAMTHLLQGVGGSNWGWHAFVRRDSVYAMGGV